MKIGVQAIFLLDVGNRQSVCFTLDHHHPCAVLHRGGTQLLLWASQAGAGLSQSHASVLYCQPIDVLFLLPELTTGHRRTSPEFIVSALPQLNSLRPHPLSNRALLPDLLD